MGNSRKTTRWPLSSRWSYPARWCFKCLCWYHWGPGHWGRAEAKVSFSRVKDSHCPVIPAAFSYHWHIPPIQMHRNIYRIPGKPSSDTEHNFILAYVSEFALLSWEVTKGGHPVTFAWPSLGWPLTAQDLGHWLGGIYRPALLKLIPLAHGSTRPHFYFQRWKLGPNYS